MSTLYTRLCALAMSFIKIKLSICFHCAHRIFRLTLHMPGNNCSCNLESTCTYKEKESSRSLFRSSIRPILSSSVFIPFIIFRITVFFYEILSQKPMAYLCSFGRFCAANRACCTAHTTHLFSKTQ